MVYDYPHFHNNFLHVVCFNQPNLGDDFGLVTLAVQVILALIIFIAFSSEHHKKAWVKWLHPGVKWVSPWLGTSWDTSKGPKQAGPAWNPSGLAEYSWPLGLTQWELRDWILEGQHAKWPNIFDHFCKNHGHLRASEGLRVPPSKTPQQIKAYHIHLKHSKAPHHGLSEQLKTHGFPFFFAATLHHQVSGHPNSQQRCCGLDAHHRISQVSRGETMLLPCYPWKNPPKVQKWWKKWGFFMGYHGIWVGYSRTMTLSVMEGSWVN